MVRQRPRSILGRLLSLLRGGFAGWVKDRETRSPQAVYEQAIEERTRHYAELKRVVAGILYMRNKLKGEIGELRNELARVLEDIRRAVRRVDDQAALALIQHKHSLGEELSRAETELEKVRKEAEEAKCNLGRFREEIRDLEREKVRMLTALANARARRRMREALDGLSLDGEMRALESVRAYVARVQAEGNLDHEVEEDGVAARIREIREESRLEAARSELDALKRRFLPRVLSAEASEPGIYAAASLAQAVER